MSENIQDILILSIPLLLCFLAFYFSIEKCPNGGTHSFEEYGKKQFVKGNDIGFGITNSFYRINFKCKKCGKIESSIE